MCPTLKQKIKQSISNVNRNISLIRKISIVGLGSISTLLILLMLEVFMAQLLTDFIIGSINDDFMLLIIVIGLFLMTIIIAFVIGYFVSQDIALKSVRNASLMSLICLFIFLFVVCNVSLYLTYSFIYSNVVGLDILWVFPKVLVLFAIYILGDVFSLFILIIVTYYLFFIFFLERFYISKTVNI